MKAMALWGAGAVLVCLLVLWSWWGSSGFTRGCDALVSDAEMTDVGSLSEGDVRMLLGELGASRVIVESLPALVIGAGERYRINPLVLLATAQKEQGLLTAKSPTRRQLAWAMGYGKPSTLEHQVDAAAWQFRRYLDHPQKYPTQVGRARALVDGTIVVKNLATAALYNYTPVLGARCNGDRALGGNGLFLYWWDRLERLRAGDR